MGSIGWIIVVVVLASILFGDTDTSYNRCAPDEVWAWQMDYRPDPENREWKCVAISDLMETK